jgi:hypothetical protein
MKDMGIDHRGFDVAMPQQLLDGSNVRAAFEQVPGKRMAERMARSSFCETSHRHGIPDGFLHQGFVNVMAALLLSPGVHPSVFLGKDPLPEPVFRRVGILSVKGIRKLDTAPTIGKILLMNGLVINGSGVFPKSSA